MQLETKNFYLKNLNVEFANEEYLSWLKNEEINRTLEVDGKNQSLKTLSEYISFHDNINYFLFGIFLKKNNKFIGTHSFRSYPKHKLATVGVMIGNQDYWGKGIPLETRARILDWAFNKIDCNKVEASCYSINYPAIYNFKRQKWKIEGIKESCRIIDNKFVDLILFGMKKKTWYEQN
jgi:RimJ/RimL family protein N-acetyltransferase